MAPPSPFLDHIVIDVRHRIDEAEQCFAALGFQLTPRGHHTLGSSNHLAMFATDYLELLGFGAGGASRDELQPFPIGLNGLVFKADDAERIYRHALAAGLPIRPIQSFSRPVTLAGETQDARFRTTRLDPNQVPMGRVYFCEHLTPDLVWRPEWQAPERRPRDCAHRRRHRRAGANGGVVPSPVRAGGGRAGESPDRRRRCSPGRAGSAGGGG